MLDVFLWLGLPLIGVTLVTVLLFAFACFGPTIYLWKDDDDA